MIIFLNGSMNAGKTTIANILAKRIPDVALVEIDALRNMISWMPIDKAVPINLINAISVIRNFSNSGLNVIVPYPLSEKNYDFMIKELEDLETKMHFFTLSPKLEKIITNRGERELEISDIERIKHHYNIGIHNPTFGEIIDNGEQTPNATVEYIISKI